MQYDDEFHQQHKMVKGESSGEKLYDCNEASLEPCPDSLFSIRQYVLLSRQKDIFQNWPFAEKYLRLCLQYGVTDVLPPLEVRALSDRMRISYENIRVSMSNAGDNNDHKGSFESTISSVCEKIELMSLSCNDDHKQENEDHSDNVYAPSKKAARKTEKSRKGRRKMKSMTEIFATAKYRTLEEDDDEINDSNWTSDNITSDVKELREQMQEFDNCDFKSEFTDDADHNKRRRVLKSWSKSSRSSLYKATLITKNRSRGCNRKTQEIYGPKSTFELQDSYIC